MGIEELARLALSRLPKPYTDEVILHVWCEIERTPRLRQMYDDLLEDRGNDPQRVNPFVSKAVSEALGADRAKKRFGLNGACELVQSVTRLEGEFNRYWNQWDE